VYVHFPFCRARCPYCDFATAVREPIPHDEYAAAVIAELSARAPWFRNTNPPGLKSIYFGGGTPGLWRPERSGGDRSHRRLFDASGPLEITVETNPGQATAESLADLRAAGVNRVSLGMQAFQVICCAGLAASTVWPRSRRRSRRCARRESATCARI